MPHPGDACVAPTKRGEGSRLGFKPRNEAKKYRVGDGDTLSSIALKNGLTWEELALFNWGTTRTDEVNRALVEIVGCQTPTRGGSSFIFSGKDSERGTGEVLVPELYKKGGLATGQTYTITVDRQRPMPAVSITALDQWFIPGPEAADGECCKISYSLEGIKERADKVSMEVHASNYCKASVDDKGKATYTPISGPMPVHKREQPAERCAARQSFSIVDWDGKSDAADGMLKPGENGDRYINVAFSPYTVMMRFHKSAADKEARLLLQDFWPRWNIEGVLQPSSLTFKWEVKGTSKLKHGQIQVLDKTDKVVHRVTLKAADLSEGKHEHPWYGELTDGSFVSRENMPYRFQVQAHSDMFEEQGLALAAMHTEVRLMARPRPGTNLIKEAYKDPNSLVLGLAPVTPRKVEELDEDRWYQYKLAEAGYHPGPVDGIHGSRTKRALEEFQRSNPKNTAAPFKRMEPTGEKDAATKAALERLAADARPVFGDGCDRRDMPRPVAQMRLRDTLEEDGIVAWVDDRHCYTEPHRHRDFLTRKLFLNNYRGEMNANDKEPAIDAETIARPFLPLQADLPLLPRGANLDAEQGEVNEASRRAIGPLRVDWDFNEIGEDLDNIDITKYKTDRVRSRKWVDDATKSLEANYQGIKCRNCPETHGGIRPSDLSSYHAKGIAHGPLSLEPWPAVDDPATKSVCTIVHDDLGQAADKLFDTHQGRAGAFAHPSRVAGDGYRYRARVSFEKLPAGLSQFPNREVLKRRYPELPKVHTCGVRLWRKTSFRGYLAWCPPDRSTWPANKAPAAEYYTPAFVHFVDEAGPDPAKPLKVDLAPLVTEDEYRDCVCTNVTHSLYKDLTISFSLDKVWPYCHLPHLGLPQGDPGTNRGNFRSEVMNPAFGWVWSFYRTDLLHLLLQKIEKNIGRLRGHLLVEFLASQEVVIEEYRCDDPNCDVTRAEVTTNCSDSDLLLETACPKNHGHKMERYSPRRTKEYDHLLLSAVGCPLGASWLFTDGRPDVWSHEMGHHRHMRHAQAWPRKKGTSVQHDLGKRIRVNGKWKYCGAPAGATLEQHDSEVHPGWASVPEEDSIHPDKDRGWDRHCIMSYNSYDLYFCGKCLMKNRGWKIMTLPNPAGTVQD